ncbi:hypothetical protein SAMN05444678_11523 [Sphingomonas sp. YR710]|uniref:hypothetical protein n=1 Tax=Sphingomonas sp. YR710 TaxID=1882773 RepID=UPI0008903C73|nr:hypothetical protein [Sphingomonas sp. YR710]SDD52693.1 hypothetical protein SAMN05444678_11523 [Sphingomonas sp. YR710]
MEPVEYVFRIDVFTPDTMPMGRLAEYLGALARLLGHPEHTHFVRLEEGSAKLVHKVDAVDVPKVETRLNGIRVGDAPKDAMQAQKTIEELLVNDNAVATLTEVATGKVVIPFIGRNRPKPMVFPPFREDTTIEGQIVNIGGRDPSAHAVLQDGDVFHTHIQMKRDLARKLAQLLYGPPVRLHGNGRFERQPDGVWKMLDFRVESFELLDDRSVAETLAAIRVVPNNRLMDAEAYRDIARLGGEEDDTQ